MINLTAGPGSFAMGGAAVLAMFALFTDGFHRQIPHWLTGGLLLLWVVGALFAGQPFITASWGSLGCGAAGLALGYGFHRAGWLGGGDGKLLGVLALWLGPNDIWLWLLSTAVLGLVLVALALILRGGDFRTRGIPFAWAMVPPASVLLIARAFASGGA